MRHYFLKINRFLQTALQSVKQFVQQKITPIISFPPRHTIQPTHQEGRVLIVLTFLFSFFGWFFAEYSKDLAHWWIQLSIIICGASCLTGFMLYRMNPHELTYKRSLVGVILIVGLFSISLLLEYFKSVIVVPFNQQIYAVLGGYMVLKCILPYAYRIPLPVWLAPTHQYEALYIEPAPMPRMAYFKTAGLLLMFAILIPQATAIMFDFHSKMYVAVGVIASLWVAFCFYHTTLTLYKTVLYSLGGTVIQGIHWAVGCDTTIVFALNIGWLLNLAFPLNPSISHSVLIAGCALVAVTQGVIFISSLKHLLATCDGMKQRSLSNQQIHIDLAVKTAQLEVEVEQHAQAKKFVENINTQLEQKVAERTQDMQMLLEELATVNSQVEKELHERKMLESQLIQSQKLESIGQLAAGVAHEINNPVGFVLSNLNTLSDYIEVLKKSVNMYKTLEQQTRHDVLIHLPVNVSEKLTPLLEHLESLHKREDLVFILDDLDALLSESVEGSKRVKEIVQGLKSFSRVDESQVKEANLNDCLDATLKVVWNKLKYTCVVYKQYGDIPELLCHPAQLNQVFMNLFVNAADAIMAQHSEGQGNLTIKTWDDSEQIYISVQDTGGGMTQKQVAKIFDPFYTTKPVGKGTGLGLAISYGIIQKHGGHIQVDTELGRGTQFTINLPKKSPFSDESSILPTSENSSKFHTLTINPQQKGAPHDLNITSLPSDEQSEPAIITAM